MSKILPSFLRASLLGALIVPTMGLAQTTPEETEADKALAAHPEFELPKWDLIPKRPNAFATSLRFLGKTSVAFSNLGTIDSGLDLDDLTSETARIYGDGYVGVDTRTDGTGSSLVDDGRTNNWAYTEAGQITDDETGITFHGYNSSPDGSVIKAESTGAVNFDLEYSRTMGHFGRRKNSDEPLFEWGWLGGWGLTDVNAKTRGTVSANLTIVSDTYSLLGAAIPVTWDEDGVDDDGNVIEGYSAPSTKTVTVYDADGNASTYTIDTTTYLANLPDYRLYETQQGAAEIEGLWQVKGAYFTVRAGPWLRWEPTEKLAVRLSAGGTMTLIGLKMRYAERLMVDGVSMSDELTEQSETETYGYGGYFGSLDAELWLSRRTGFFCSAYYEGLDESLTLEIGGRKADADVSSGLGLRMGVSTRF